MALFVRPKMPRLARSVVEVVKSTLIVRFGPPPIHAQSFAKEVVRFMSAHYKRFESCLKEDALTESEGEYEDDHKPWKLDKGKRLAM